MVTMPPKKIQVLLVIGVPDVLILGVIEDQRLLEIVKYRRKEILFRRQDDFVAVHFVPAPTFIASGGSLPGSKLPRLRFPFGGRLEHFQMLEEVASRGDEVAVIEAEFLGNVADLVVFDS